MHLSRGILPFIFLSISAGAGCANGTADGQDNAPENVGQSSDALRALQDNEKLGSMAYDQTNTVNYTENPLYRAYSFTAGAGDTVDIWVKSTTSTDAMAWLLASDYTTLAQNDNANTSTKDAHINYTISSAGTYWIAMREANQENATFTVSLNGSGAPGNVFDPNLCTGGTRMTKDQVLHYFVPGTDTSDPIANVTVYERKRACNTATGCGPWQVNASPVKWTGDNQNVSGGTFYAKVGSSSNIYFYFKRAMSDSSYIMSSGYYVGQYDPNYMDVTSSSSGSSLHFYDNYVTYYPSQPLQANTSCFAMSADQSTSPDANSDYTEAEVVFYGSTLAPTH